MGYRVWAVAAALLLASIGRVDAASKPEESGIERSADQLLIGIPVAALGLTFLIADDLDLAKPLGFDLVNMTGSPRHDLGLALGRTIAVSYGLKYAVQEERPNGEDNRSFPSGHTAVTFAGAEFIRKHYGWGYGVPAYAAATFVGWSRVATDDHWGHDVAVGAAIGILSNYDFGDWHGVTVKPAMFQTLDVAPGVAEVPGTAPGLRLELRF
jgi:membrane-associated phospholipid phosphatase